MPFFIWNRTISIAIKSWPATVLSREGDGLLWRLLHHTTGAVNTLRPSKLVDNSDRWTLFIPLDWQRTDNGRTDVCNQRIMWPFRLASNKSKQRINDYIL